MKTRWIFFLLSLAAAGCSIKPQETRESLPLHGEWKFRADPLDEGLSGQWYREAFKETVTLPGSMAENGKGNDPSLETDWTGTIVDSSYFTQARYEKYRQPGNFKIPFWLKPVKHYKGAAWYQREFDLPTGWHGKRVMLHLERCHWESTLFVNDHPAGSRNSLAVPHQYDITELLEQGNNRITIRVDNRMVVPVGINSHSVSDHTQSNWNGIVGEIFLEARNPVCIEHVEVYPDLSSSSARLVVSLQNSGSDRFEGTLHLQATSFNTGNTHAAPELTEEVQLKAGEQSIEVHYPMGEDAALWSEFSPALYQLEVLLKNGQGDVVDRMDTEFGMRQFTASGTRFRVNGHPVFLRGTLECCIFPLTGYPPSDVPSWEYLLKRCMEHGLNHVRFHSWCPPEAAFRAADRLGIYLQVECSSWANQGTTLGDGGSIDTFIYQESERIVEAYGNHPSFCMMAYGNEPGGPNHVRFLKDWLEYWKERDPGRVYTAAAGWPLIPENQYQNGPQPRIQGWGQGLGSIINASPPQNRFDYREIISRYDVPFVSHEIGQWCVYPDFREIQKYTGVLKPANFEIFREMLRENHMGHQSESFLMASGKLQALCYKAEIEAALRTPGFAGFQLLQLHDFPGQGTALVGILDPFFNSKGYISPEEFRRFCNQTVPLARMDKRVWLNSETFRAEIEIAHFGKEPLTDQRIFCRISGPSGNTIYQTVLEREEIPVDNHIALGVLEYELADIDRAVKLILEVSLEGTPYSNSWDLWVYPESVENVPGKVLITQSLDERALDKLSEGGAVLLLCSEKISEEYGGKVEIGFSSIFWNTAWTRGQAPHTLGILCDPQHPLYSEFPTGYHSDWQWWDPVTHSRAMILDHLPGELAPLIQPIDTWFENRRLGLLFEATVSDGKLMVCSIDLQKDMDQRPVSRQLLNSILDYMNSDQFDPAVTLTPDLVRKMMGD